MKGFKSLASLMALMGCAAALSACSVEATAPPVNFGVDAGPAPTSSAAKLMAVEGTWTSDCNYQSGIYIKETTTFADNGVAVQVDMYYGSACTGTPTDTQKLTGTMNRVGSSFYVAGGHDVEVKMTSPDGTIQSTNALFLLENGVLYTSDSEGASPLEWPRSVDRSKPYRRVGG